MPAKLLVTISLALILIISNPEICSKGLTTNISSSQDNTYKQILKDVVKDFELFTFLLQDVHYVNGYAISNTHTNLETAIAYLSQGFDEELARNIVGYYFQHIPELDKLAVVPTDSIPILVSADKDYLTIRYTGTNTVVLERIYSNCYELGDKYIYKVTAKFKDLNWKITDLNLVSINS